MRAFDVVQEVRSGTIGQFQVQRDEIDAVLVENGQGCACILRGENVEVLLEDLREGRTGGGLIVDDQDRRSMVGLSGTRVEGIVSLVSLSHPLVKEIARIHVFAPGCSPYSRRIFGHSSLGFCLSTWV